MTFIRDLEPCTYFDCPWTMAPQREVHWIPSLFSTSLQAVGWLGTTADFAIGPIPKRVRDRLDVLARAPWQPWRYFGFHYCGLCARRRLHELARAMPPAAESFTEDFIESQCNDSHRWLDDSSAEDDANIFIPGVGIVYAVPRLILHYIDTHQYQPPTAFCDAVLACPPMRSAQYFAALLRNSSGDFRNFVELDLASFDDWSEPDQRRFGKQRPTRDESRKSLWGLNRASAGVFVLITQLISYCSR